MKKKEENIIIKCDAKQCPVCKIYVDVNMKFCHSCGAVLD